MKNTSISNLIIESNLSFRRLSKDLRFENIHVTAQHLHSIMMGKSEISPDLEENIRQYLTNQTIIKRSPSDDINDLCEISKLILENIKKSSVSKLILKTALYKAVAISERLEETHTLFMSTAAFSQLQNINNKNEVKEFLVNNPQDIIVTNVIPYKMLITAIYENESIFSKKDFLLEIIDCASQEMIIVRKELQMISFNKRDILDNWNDNVDKWNDKGVCSTFQSIYKQSSDINLMAKPELPESNNLPICKYLDDLESCYELIAKQKPSRWSLSKKNISEIHKFLSDSRE